MSSTHSKVVLVTGAARGIGLATAKRFLADRWRVGLLDIDAAGLERAVAELARPGETLALTCDIADPRQVAAA
ncbi:SDR family NAD(P)-dependent oxidoreductase, partial [Bosea sp. (in: a-proteobacteria)]|uniref:SDR family NAD(P)-dependent oxidoreductase n=1 Tax=Bosea sp. (in: a-proteobacteria) TaxID=1871050 RepID=UPI001AC9D075